MTPRRIALHSVATLILAVGAAPLALSWTINLNSASQRVYLHVGDGVRNGDLGTVNEVSVTVPFNQVVNGAPMTMVNNSTQRTSLHRNNGGIICDPYPDRLLIGASYQRNNAGGGAAPMTATLSVTSPPFLVNANGDTIPMSEVSWSVSTQGTPNGPAGDRTYSPYVIPPGTFNGGYQFLTTIQANTYIENCHTFYFANSAPRAAGTYRARVTYTVSSP